MHLFIFMHCDYLFINTFIYPYIYFHIFYFTLVLGHPIHQTFHVWGWFRGDNS